jgi:selenoprotein W-related protein
MPTPDDGRIRIRVEYCAPCNYLLRTTWLLSEMLAEIQDSVADATLVPGDSGVLEWFVDDELVFSKAALGRFPELDELKELVYAKLA